MWKRLLVGLVVMLVAFAVCLGVTVFNMKKTLDSFDKTPVEMADVKDGVYEGESNTTLVKVKVKVTVVDGKIDDIEILKHECGKGKPANDIVEDMVSKNSAEVDAVSGATVSSDVIKDAVRKALRKGLK